MPIAPEHRWLYPIDWAELSDLFRFTRAKGRCQQCARPHGYVVKHLGNGVWWDDDRLTWRDGQGKQVRALPHPDFLGHEQPVLAGIEPPLPYLLTRVFIACAHLNHDPGDNRPRNLAVLCQRCHMIHDWMEHRRRRWLNAFRLRAIGDLLAGLEGERVLGQ